MRRWGFLTNHALVLIHVTQHPHSTVREIADAVGVTERAGHSVLGDLREAGIIDAERSGRRNSCYGHNICGWIRIRRNGDSNRGRECGVRDNHGLGGKVTA